MRCLREEVLLSIGDGSLDVVGFLSAELHRPRLLLSSIDDVLIYDVPVQLAIPLWRTTTTTQGTISRYRSRSTTL